MIKSIRHKGLKKFFNSGGNDTRGINSDHEDRLRDQLAALDSATEITDMDLPGWRLHPLKGKDKGRHAIWVSGNWRMTFEFENGDASQSHTGKISGRVGAMDTGQAGDC